MIRKGRFKYVHYVHYPPLLYDLAKDPGERRNVAEDADYAPVLHDCEAELRRILDPAEVDRRAKADQSARIEAGGGVEEVLTKGSPGYTPAPGEDAVFIT